MPEKILIINCSQLVTCRSNSPKPKLHDDFASISMIERGAMVIESGQISWIGSEGDIDTAAYKTDFGRVIDAESGVVTPGLIDPHTHPVFAASREAEFYLRNAGKSYMEIAEQGGGIRNSVRKLRITKKDQLLANCLLYLKRMLENGTTTIEAKSGYGLSTDSEIKSLEVIREAGKQQPIELVPTFLGAHEFPDEYREDHEGYIRLLTEEMLPEVARRNLAMFCDIFTEKGVFSIEESRIVMTAAKDCGFKLKFHADEIEAIGGAQLAAELGAVSADHLVRISSTGIEKMAAAGTIAVLLPSTTFFLGHSEYAPARQMIEAGAPIALATDFNPGSSFNTSLPATMTIAAIYLGLKPAELLNSVTFNAACAICRQDSVGSLEVGKQADFVIWQTTDYRRIPYSFGQNLVSSVYKRGEQVV